MRQASCPKCGRKLGLVAAGYYCMKCDMLLDKETLTEIAATERRAGWLLPQKKLVWLETREGQLRVGELAIPIRSIRSIKPTGNKVYVAKKGDLALMLVLGGALLAAAGAAGENQTGRVDEVEIQYRTETGYETVVRIGTGDPAFLTKTLAMEPGSTTIASTMTEPTMFCRECGAKIARDSVYCEECGTSLA